MRLFVAVPGGNCNHFHDPTRSYLKGSEEELASARSTVTRTCVSTRDLVPPSGMLGNMIGRLEGLSLTTEKEIISIRTCNRTLLEGEQPSASTKNLVFEVKRQVVE